MKNQSTVKYLDQILDTSLTEVRLHAMGSDSLLIFEPDRWVHQVVKNILEDNQVCVSDVGKVAYMVTQNQLMVDFQNDNGHVEFLAIDFPLAHTEVKSRATLSRALEMSKH